MILTARSFYLLSFAGVFLMLFSGCGEANPRREISGKVVFKGNPLDNGVIEFHPVGPGQSGVPTTMEASVITNGDYKILAEAGLTPGKYKVVISSGDNVDPNNPDGLPGPTGNYVSKDRIPKEYNTASTQEVEVKDSGPNVFDWDIK